MTSLLSDMRTVRPQGLTFRITQPHGLRISYLGTPQDHCKGRDEILSRCLHATIRGNNVEIRYSNQIVIFKFRGSFHYYYSNTHVTDQPADWVTHGIPESAVA